MDYSKYLEKQVELCEKHSQLHDIVNLSSLIALAKNFNPNVKLMAYDIHRLKNLVVGTFGQGQNLTPTTLITLKLLTYLIC
jgi:hypothetical protein